MKKIKTALSIAGSDCSGGAGIQADLKTFSALGVYGMTVLTALTAQNTCSVKSCHKVPPKFVEEQLEAIFEDIIPDSIKIGMLFSADIIITVSSYIKKYALNIPIILDPVMIAKSGDSLLQPEAIEALKSELLPITTILTPNLPEAYALTGQKSAKPEDLAQMLLGFGSRYVLVKGGHANTPHCQDFFLAQDGAQAWLASPRIDSKNTHGTGCTISSAICSFMAEGKPALEACQLAKEYIFNAISASKDCSVGKGSGPVQHFYAWWE